jgi:hypothetical protein
LQAQAEGFDAAAARVAAWGNTTWTGISSADSSDDWRAATGRLHTSTLADNRVWLADAAKAGLAVDTRFIEAALVAFPEAAARETTLQIGAQKPASTLLTCPPLAFDGAALTDSARAALTTCALPQLRDDERASLEIRSGSAWPGPRGTYTAAQVEDAARGKAQLILDYLVSQGIDADRIDIVTVLPPEARRETTDLSAQAQDYFVQLTLQSPVQR